MRSPSTSLRLSTAAKEVAEFGIDTANMFGFWDGSADAIRFRPLSTFAYDRHRAFQLREVPKGLLEDGPALPYGQVLEQHARNNGASRHPLLKRLRRRDVLLPALRPVSLTLSGVPAADGHGVERQVDRPRGKLRGARHRSHRVGRAGHERTAFVLPAHPPGARTSFRATSSAAARRTTRSATCTTS